MTEPKFTETTRTGVENGYRIAQGWTASSGRGGAWAYILPDGWEFDPNYDDETGRAGSHGGCSGCTMTLIHLRTIEKVRDTTAMLIVVAIAAYIVYATMRR